MTPIQARELARQLNNAATAAELAGHDEIDLQSQLSEQLRVDLDSLAAEIAAKKSQ